MVIRLVKLLFIFSFLLTLNVAGQIVVDCDFEGGNIEIVSVSDSANSVTFIPGVDSTNITRCWFYFKTYGYNKSIPLKICIKYDSYVKAPNYPVYSYDQENWMSVRSEIADGMKFFFIIPQADTIYFATGYPYLYSQLLEFEQSIAGNKNIDTSTLTYSEEGRRIPEFIIRSKNYGNGKDILWIIGRQHAFESLSNYVIEGMVEFFISEDSLAENLRENTEIHIVPIMDVDNVYKGQSGRMQLPVDFNRDWNPESYWNAVSKVKEKLTNISVFDHYRIFIDIHSTYPGGTYQLFSYFDIYNRYPETNRLNQLWDYFAQFQGFEPKRLISEGVVTDEIYADQYNSNYDCKHYSIPCFHHMEFAFTLECDWNISPDSSQWTPDKLRETGENLGRAISVYLSELAK